MVFLRLFFKLSLVFIIILFISSCSSLSFIYWGGEVYANHKINTTIPLNSEQKKLVKAEVKDFFNWHKINRLPEYEKLFTRINAPLNSFPLAEAVVKDEVSYVFQNLEKEQVVLAKALIPKIVRVFETFDQKQIDHIEKLFNKPSPRRDKYYSLSKEDYDNERLERVIKVAGFFGVKFNKEQKKDLSNQISNLLDNRKFFKPFYQEKRENLLAAIKSRDKEKLTTAFEEIMIYDVNNFPPEYKKFYFEQQEKAESFVYAVFAVLSKQQLKNLYSRLNNLSLEIATYLKKVSPKLKKFYLKV